MILLRYGIKKKIIMREHCTAQSRASEKVAFLCSQFVRRKGLVILSRPILMCNTMRLFSWRREREKTLRWDGDDCYCNREITLLSCHCDRYDLWLKFWNRIALCQNIVDSQWFDRFYWNIWSIVRDDTNNFTNALPPRVFSFFFFSSNKTYANGILMPESHRKQN